MVEVNKIPHIDEISNHGAFAGAGQKKTATFRERYHQQNSQPKIWYVPCTQTEK